MEAFVILLLSASPSLESPICRASQSLGDLRPLTQYVISISSVVKRSSVSILWGSFRLLSYFFSAPLRLKLGVFGFVDSLSTENLVKLVSFLFDFVEQSEL